MDQLNVPGPCAIAVINLHIEGPDFNNVSTLTGWLKSEFRDTVHDSRLLLPRNVHDI